MLIDYVIGCPDSFLICEFKKETLGVCLYSTKLGWDWLLLLALASDFMLSLFILPSFSRAILINSPSILIRNSLLSDRSFIRA